MAVMTFWMEHSVFLAVGCVFVTISAIAFSDVIIDSLLVVQARRDPENGSANLSTFVWTCQALGGLLGAITAAFLTQEKDARVCFIIYGFLGLLVLFGAL